VGAAAGGAVLDGQVAAGNVKHGIGVEVTVCIPKSPERNSLGVSQQPGGLVIERGWTLVHSANPEEYT